MTEAENIRKVERLGVGMMGFIFYSKSPRCLCQMPGYLPTRAKRVGVFVNESEENIRIHADCFGLDYIQLHGDESPEQCRSLRNKGLRLIKAFSIKQADDLNNVPAYDGLCDFYLFDTRTSGYGGSGEQFDWNLLQRYDGTTPFLLSGGIGPDSVQALREFSHPRLAGIDLNSRFETAPGIKDAKRIAHFLNQFTNL